MIGRTLAHRSIGNVSILVHGNYPPDPSEFDQWLDLVIDARPEGSLVVTPGPGPSAAQRKDMLARLQEARLTPRTAVVTDSTIARGIVTALSWFQAYELRAFSPKQMTEALAFVAPPEERDEIRMAVLELQHALETPIVKVG